VPGSIDITATMALCFAAWGFFYAGLHRRWGINYTNYFLITTTYFLAVGAVLLIGFWSYFVPVLENVSSVPLVTLCIFMFLQVLVCIYIPKYVREPKEYFERYPDRYFLKIGWRRLIAKSADIVAQQVFIILLVVLLKDEGLSLLELYLVFGVLFMLLHVPLIASEKGSWVSWLFVGIVIAFSIIFPTFILFVPYGFIYNIELHWFFYTGTAVVFWLTYDSSVRLSSGEFATETTRAYTANLDSGVEQ
jgi:hypothetical protein